MGRVAIPDIPETRWIPETVGEGYIQKNPIIKRYIKQLEEIQMEREGIKTEKQEEEK